MATRKNELEEERMTPQNIEKVIKMLNPPEGSDYKAWTKKEACQFLGMAYNTTRLGTILEKHQEKKARDTQRRAERRGKPAQADEITYAISEYLQGSPVDAIATALYRSSSFVKRILDENAVPIRQGGHSYFSPELVPEAAMRDRFSVGEVVYSARYDTTARIETEKHDPRHGWIYRLWLQGEKWLQYCYQPAYELASLEHLRKLGIKI